MFLKNISLLLFRSVHVYSDYRISIEFFFSFTVFYLYKGINNWYLYCYEHYTRLSVQNSYPRIYFKSSSTWGNELTLYPSRALMEGSPKDNINLCPITIQQILKKRMPWRQVSVSTEDFVASNFEPLVDNENERSISFLRSETPTWFDVNKTQHRKYTISIFLQKKINNL